MPKFPPPPRTPQNRSAFSFGLAVTLRPSANTISTDSRLSTVSPCLRTSQPKPPPSVNPAMPVLETNPPVVAKPRTRVALIRAAHDKFGPLVDHSVPNCPRLLIVAVMGGDKLTVQISLELAEVRGRCRHGRAPCLVGGFLEFPQTRSKHTMTSLTNSRVFLTCISN